MVFHNHTNENISIFFTDYNRNPISTLDKGFRDEFQIKKG